MDTFALPALVEEHLAAARSASSGRSAHTIHGGHEHALRQTILALLAGHGLGDHESPTEATVQVLAGRVVLTAGDDFWEGTVGDYLVLPPHRHSLDAVEDSVLLLTVAADLGPH
jgi:quercetin dioxygenase-like cupin family protein